METNLCLQELIVLISSKEVAVFVELSNLMCIIINEYYRTNKYLPKASSAIVSLVLTNHMAENIHFVNFSQ